ncbi:hypothetical protein TSAR_010018 [Trichomalopsis sarcophagae]|uniref:Uncharacterized protein n=1 Tax=Trichomalopsis sarcophagae TaxID=543379 RepID=A0A232FK06_9HYME|nr:hypothetical protein TSAR_010018 [Trichomalopsis sarcophagae]
MSVPVADKTALFVTSDRLFSPRSHISKLTNCAKRLCESYQQVREGPIVDNGGNTLWDEQQREIDNHATTPPCDETLKPIGLLYSKFFAMYLMDNLNALGPDK